MGLFSILDKDYLSRSLSLSVALLALSKRKILASSAFIPAWGVQCLVAQACKDCSPPLRFQQPNTHMWMARMGSDFQSSAFAHLQELPRWHLGKLALQSSRWRVAGELLSLSNIAYFVLNLDVVWIRWQGRWASLLQDIWTAIDWPLGSCSGCQWLHASSQRILLYCDDYQDMSLYRIGTLSPQTSVHLDVNSGEDL